MLPLVKHALLSGRLIAYIFCLRGTGITMLVYPPGCDTLPVRIFTLMANGAPDLIAAACVDDRHDGAASGRRRAHHANPGKARMR